ncbi:MULTISPECIES: DUF4129 domain-containing protein [unclassified Streptomyces]|uniref:DUF4129 domain-containing protein n=1 Tax=unclassified Streptomyces TaxID=2593676 RepID=UPI000DC4271D|nr:DUF4129 domain-containing protein [Streptomyces sp. PsTaAH-130]RAJ54846.1 uncharacterized protein DUF4129 [Streptomyces sp. PsTaAH-130]
MGRREHTAGGRRRYGTIGGAQVVLTVLVVGGTAVGALLLRPDAGLSAKGRGPLGGNAVLVGGLALLAFLGGLALREQYRKRVRAVRGLGPVEQRLVDGVSRVLPAASLVVPLLVLALHRFALSGSGQETDLGGSDGPSASPTPREVPVPAPPSAAHVDHGIRFGLTPLLLALGIALFAVAVVVAGLYLRRYLARPPALHAPSASASASAVPGDERDRLTRAVDSGRRALLDGTDARAAVIACYATMEESLAASGVARRASDSPQDLLERATAGGLPARAAVGELTALFREARYSTHPMDDGHRDRAAAALTEIADGLRARTAGSGAVAGAS